MLRKASLTQDLKDEQGVKESSVEKAFPGEKNRCEKAPVWEEAECIYSQNEEGGNL